MYKTDVVWCWIESEHTDVCILNASFKLLSTLFIFALLRNDGIFGPRNERLRHRNPYDMICSINIVLIHSLYNFHESMRFESLLRHCWREFNVFETMQNLWTTG